MRSLYLKFLLSFWLVISLIIGAAAVGGFLYAEQLQAVIEDFETGRSMQEANAALQERGLPGLVRWREGTPPDDGVVIFFLDERGQDISFDRIPFAVERVFERHRARYERMQRDRANGGIRVGAGGRVRSQWRSRLLPQLVAPTDEVLTMLVAPVRAPEAFWANQDIRVLLFVFALLTSGLVSYVLASTFSRPVRKLRDATVALAEGNLDVRVTESIGKRRDELGMLGRDFDSMAAKLQRAAEQQTELSRNISHELRSPLARMRVAVELARRKSGELPEFDRLNNETKRLDALVGQILSYTKLEADREQSLEEVELLDLISEVVENVNFEYKAERASVEADVTRATVPGHRGALLSAVENIVRNAVRHSPSDSEVRIVVDTNDGGWRIDVVDDGSGVAEEDLPHLFEPFFRTRASAEADGNGGTGLGLAIAQRAVVDLHGGQLAAENRQAGGLLVRITLLA